MTTVFIGIDIAKSSFHAHTIGSQKLSFDAPNTDKGFERLHKAVTQDAQVMLAIEATSTYHTALADWAHAQGWQVFVLNPAKLKHYVRSQRTTHKDDAIDARLIAQYVSKHHEQLHAYRPQSLAHRQLRALSRRREQLTKMMTQESNRQGHLEAHSQLASQSHQRLMKCLKEELEQVQADIQKLCAKDEVLKRKHKLLCQVPMVGCVIASALLAELGDVGRFKDAKEVTAWAGLVPLHERSGSSVNRGGKLSRQGNRRIRQLLYMAAMGAMRCKAWQPWILKRQNNGKQGKKLLVAIMDKLLRICWGMLKHDTKFDQRIAFSA